MKMRILFAYYRYSPYTNGPSTYIDTLRKELQRQGHQVDLLTHDPDWIHLQLSNGNKINKINVKAQLVQQWHTWYLSRFHPWVFWREMERYALERSIGKLNIGQYDLIHCHDFIMARAIGRLKPSYIPLVVSLHNCKYHEAIITGNFYSKTLSEQQYIQSEEYLGAMSADKILVPSCWLKQQLIKIGVDSSKIHVYPYGVSKEPFEKRSDGQLDRIESSSNKVILCLGRLVDIKGHRYLIKALKLIQDERDDFVCWIAGDGPLLKELQKMANDCGVRDRISFLGKRKDVPSLLKASDLVVLPSLHDTFPLALLEGQLAGRPVIGTNVGGIPEIIEHGNNGFLVSPRDSQSLAHTITLLLRDDVLRQSLGRQAEKWALTHANVAEHVKQILSVYKELRNTSNNISSYSCSFHSWKPDVELLVRISTNPGYDPSFEQGLLTYRNKIPSDIPISSGIKLNYVHLFDSLGVNLQTAEIDKNGEFVFHWIPKGNYILRSTISKLGDQSISI
ncbi:glycosyltransferase family 4 protein [Alicyclobacillus dauci]|uniref:Glycosyltransferase family 4 protein n=1 Tax=Alicyclobacillus dauci TaxID=1475485 RepID=A0ABY6Z3R0_9BACL|nr:glycosyltransferase family 4 protein [Alicyclobacillus dauci]WAH37523.1 glycosyltransferase family 4 protein [Alicyclobacillus dauci]